jgi:hypothetical protein
MCCMCGAEYEAPARQPSRTCSRKCTAALVAQIKRSRVRPDSGE